MAIRIHSKPPSGSHDAIARYFSDSHTRPFMEGVDLENIGASDAYPVHVASLDQLASGKLPEEPHHWRHLLVQGGGAVAEADVVSEKGEARVVAVHRGPRVVGTVKALEGAHELEAARKHDYDLRLLEGPSIHLVALWLHSKNDDVLIPIEPDLTGLEHHRAIPLKEALPALRERAAAVQKAAKDYPGPSGN